MTGEGVLDLLSLRLWGLPLPWYMRYSILKNKALFWRFRLL